MKINEFANKSKVDEEWYDPRTWFKKKSKSTSAKAPAKGVKPPAVTTTDIAPAAKATKTPAVTTTTKAVDTLIPKLGTGSANKAANQIKNKRDKTQKALDAFKKEMGETEVKEGDMEADQKNPHAQPFLHLPEWKMLHDIDDKIISAYVKHKSIARAAGRGIQKGLKKLSKLGSKKTSYNWDGENNGYTQTTTYNETKEQADAYHNEVLQKLIKQLFDVSYDVRYKRGDSDAQADTLDKVMAELKDLRLAFPNKHYKIGEDKNSDTKQKRIAIDTVKNPNKALLGGPSVSEAEDILKTKFGYSDNQIAKLKGVDESKLNEAAPKEGDVLNHNELGKVKVLKIIQKGWGGFGKYLIQTSQGNKTVSHDELMGNKETSEGDVTHAQILPHIKNVKAAIVKHTEEDPKEAREFIEHLDDMMTAGDMDVVDMMQPDYMDTEARDSLITYFMVSISRDPALFNVLFPNENIEEYKSDYSYYFEGVEESLKEFTLSDLKGMGIKPTREQFHKLQKMNHENGGNITRSDLQKVGINEQGVIVPGVNTTVDVKPGQTEIEAAKFGNGKIKPLMPKGKSSSHILFNLGLAEHK